MLPNAYFKERGMNRADELDAILRAKEGDQEARDKLVFSNILWLIKMTPVFSEHSRHELIHVGIQGLLEAIDNYDPIKGVRFWSFAYHSIRRRLIEFYYSNNNVRHISGRTRARWKEEGRWPTRTDLPQEMLEAAITTPNMGENYTFYNETAKLVQCALATLKPLERDILVRHVMYEESTLQEIADDWKLSRERIRQIETIALEKLKKHLKVLNGRFYSNEAA